MAFRTGVIDSVFAGNIWGSKLMANLALFALAIIFVHLLFGALCWAMARLWRVAWPDSTAPAYQSVLAIFLLMTIAAFANNAAGFPLSSLGEPYADLLVHPLVGIRLGHWVALIIIAGLAITCAIALTRLWQWARDRRNRSAGSGRARSGHLISFHRGFRQPVTASASQPNVILIGIDSCGLTCWRRRLHRM